MKKKDTVRKPVRKKTRDSSKKVDSLTISRAEGKDIRSMLSWRSRGLSKEAKETVCQAYLDWAQDPSKLDWIEFFHEQGIPIRTWQDWFKADDDIRALHNHVKTIMGARHNKMARFPKKHDANPEAFIKTLRLFHPDWREAYDEDQKNREKEAAGSVTVVLDRIESTDVPELDG